MQQALSTRPHQTAAAARAPSSVKSLDASQGSLARSTQHASRRVLRSRVQGASPVSPVRWNTTPPAAAQRKTATWIARQAHQRAAVAAPAAPSHQASERACCVPGSQQPTTSGVAPARQAWPGQHFPNRPASKQPTVRDATAHPSPSHSPSAWTPVKARDHPASPPSAPSATSSSSFCQPRRPPAPGPCPPESCATPR
ncbi:hypothetical protein B0J12DRAFT_703146 [Macrophomina phaseolina]|uniref:Uncharacterized protein n=1 Tax=Macrophomina phaseolina TaxID=35725 RepID=A0ABQ8FZE0_9PEZI|nr:hypothetical protein B0J12DRAFT_703146 [Macrophomina phaseolina]